MHRLYKYIFFLILLCFGLSAEALTKDPDEYWLITSVEDFTALANDESIWKDNFKQVADLDFGMAEIPQIGRRGKAFTGTYDGQGCKISNGVMYWNPVLLEKSKEVAFGLFRYVNGTSAKPACLKNISITGVTLTITYDTAPDSTTFNKDNDDVKLGMLVGALGQYSDIQNIAVADCRIDDGSLTSITPHGIYVGGVVGDVTVSYGGTTVMQATNFALKSIYSNVNIDLRNISSTRIENFQANAGGIVGRIRFPDDMRFIPSETLFSGEIILPIGSESPVVGAMRVRKTNNAQNDPTFVAAYAGEFGPTESENQTVYDSFISDGVFNADAYEAFCKKHRFYDYCAYNSNSTKVEKITDINPSTGASCLYGTRTFIANNAFKKLDKTKLNNNAQLQGVNYGYLTNPTTEQADIIGMLDSGIGETYTDAGTEKKKYIWRFDGTKFESVRNYLADWYELKIKVNETTGNYEAKVFFKYTDKEFLPGADATFQWWASTSVKDGGDWVAITDGVTNTLVPDRSKYYKVTWTAPDGLVYESDYCAPTRTVYVFNPEYNNEFNSNFTLDHNSSASAIQVHKLETALYPDAGNDDNDGLTPGKAVLTMARAFDLLDEDGDEMSNRIVVMGYYVDDNFLQTNNINSYKDKYINVNNTLPPYSKPATITGTDNDIIYHGILGLRGEEVYDAKTGKFVPQDYSLYLTAPLRFDNLDIMRHWRWEPSSKSTKYGNSFYIVCNYFDLTIDQNVRFINLPSFQTGYGLPQDITSIPYFTLVGGTYNWNFDCETNPLLYPVDLYPGRKNFYAEEGRANINISSGVYGRIICSGRNSDNVHAKSHNITGNYKVPSRLKLNINIKDDIDFDKDGHQYTSYGVDVAYDTSTGKFYFTSSNFSHNVGLISGGQTDGSTYGDIEMNIFSGYIGRIITSNITYGREIPNYPTDSFYGRSILNIYGKTTFDEASGKVWSETTINEVFGGILGRIGTYTSLCKPYFYGQSSINMYGGYIGPYLGRDDSRGLNKLKTITPSIYGAGSGGVAGLGDEHNHTSDPKIPYLEGETIVYGAFDKDKRMPVMRMFDNKIVDLNQTECFVNLYGGIVQGNVYGAGYGYSDNIPYQMSVTIDKVKYTYDVYLECPSDLGALYGNSYVSMLKHPDYQPALVLGNVYGSGAGDSRYAVRWDADNASLSKEERDEQNPYLAVAKQFGNTKVMLRSGTVGYFRGSTGGDVFGGAQGIPEFENIAALFGNTDIEIDGATVYGNIFAGSELANIRKRNGLTDSGNTLVTISSGTIGNNIFGGSKGVDKDKETGASAKDSKAIIEGDSHVNVNGGDFFGYPYIKYNQEKMVDGKPINIVTHRSLYRTFNIYGGGYLNCDIKGDSHVNVLSSLLCDIKSFPEIGENANAVIEFDVDDENHSKRFHSAYMDLTFRSFCVYGGGYGEKTNVLNTNVYVKIPEDRANVALPHGNTLTRFLDHQSFFDIAGGGYSGDIGYWANVDGVPVSMIPEPTLADLPLTAEELGSLSERDKQIKLGNYKATLYDHYVGGNCKVIIDGYTYARKIIGGGFYGSCRNTNTHVRCGSLRQVYGGSLLGYVHDRAYLQFGNRIEDFIHAVPDGSGGYNYKFDATGVYDFTGSVNDVMGTTVWTDASYRARELNQYIFITENIYGGNDVKGIIGTEKWTSPEGNYGIDYTDGGPLYHTDVTQTEQKGIVFNIYGGTFMGDVYSAGNGHYRGYYVPEWVRYDDGPKRMYRTVRSSVDPDKTAKAYRSRPMVGSVNVNLRGNSADDYITILGNFFGGGRECSIGQYNTFLPLEDPRRLVKGGHLHVNFGGYVHINGNVYLGAEGKLYSEQRTVPADINLKTFNGSTTSELAKLGDTAYEHWYFNTKENRYVPGFPAPGEVDGNFGMTGEHMFHGYMKNIEMEGDVALTFYRYLYERNDDGSYEIAKDEEGNDLMTSDGEKIRKRKEWVPGELAMKVYDAEDIKMRSFYLGGLCGSMTNNNVMIYDFTDNKSYEEDDAASIPATNEKEDWGAVYRVSLPRGVTVRENVVMGSENATMKTYAYEEGYHKLKKDDGPMYDYEGGVVTHSGYGFDLIVYNDLFHNANSTGDNAPWRDLPDDFYNPEISDYNIPGTEDKIYKLNEYLHSNGTYLYRKNYKTEGYHLSDVTVAGFNITDSRFGLAVTGDPTTNPSGYIGRREHRRLTGTATGVPIEYKNKMTVSKLTVGCQFDLMGDHSSLPTLYGGNIYGGCYNSGIVIGDVVMNIGSNLLGNAFDDEDDQICDHYASLKYNIGRIFGGGYGLETTVDGDTYINLVRNFKGMSVFGGGMEGNVTGTANINYIGDENQSIIHGAIYGGGLRGSLGTENVTEQATTVRLFSGNVNSVFGGSCMGELYGRTFVELCDEVTTEISHFDYERFLKYNTTAENWSGSRLVAGNVFGGNDIAGIIHPHPDNKTPDSAFVPSTIEDHFKYFTTGVYIHETKETPSASSPAHKNTPGAKNGYNGFPLVGNLYGGSNGSYGTHDADNINYADGEVEIATGEENKTMVIKLSGEDEEYHTDAMSVPNVESAHLMISGGSVVNGYSGGDMATITDKTKITVDYPAKAMEARAGFKTVEELDRVWSVLDFSYDEQRSEVTKLNEEGQPIFDFQIFRLFGGNNNADMKIQPDWTLTRGHVGSLYSGGNFGKMTYYGLSLTIDSYDMELDYVYGGGRVGDIEPELPAGVTEYPDEFYGATLNINRGIIDHVYGGNDVAGFVHNGTCVNITGAISGDVYCAGNGNYFYKYDRRGDLIDYTAPKIKEAFEGSDPNFPGTRYFILPAKEEYGFTGAKYDAINKTGYDASDALTLMAINSYRPHVERAKLTIAGTAENEVWVRGKVYCGGNSASIVPKYGSTSYDVKFDIGSYVTLNGVYMGSNGESLSLGETIQRTEALNAVEGNILSVTAVNDLTAAMLPDADKVVVDNPLYPNILDLYMRAVEVVDKPENFNFKSGLVRASIGEFCVGGNRGSMMTDKRIDLEFPADLTIFGKIIGGCMDANVTYKGVTHIGGLTRPLDPNAPGYDGNKVHFKVKSRFVPMFINYPDTEVVPPISVQSNFVDGDGKSIMILDTSSSDNTYIVNPSYSGKIYYPNEQCNIFGGCLTSGTTIGGIALDVYSDMLNYDKADATVSKDAVYNGIVDARSWRSFTIVGAGCGANTAVIGNVSVRLLPSKDMSPSAASIFGGSQEGLVVGNTNVEIRDGKVFTNVYGASEAAKMYGSTSVIIGYPRYYKALKTGNYRVNRVDYMSEVSRNDGKDGFDEIVVPKTLAYLKGDIVPQNIYDMLLGRVLDSRVEAVINDTDFRVGKNVEDKYVEKFDDSHPISSYFAPVTSSVAGFDHIVPEDFGVTWDDINIWIGDQMSNINPDNKYYGQGNVYGGGYVPNSSDVALVGQPTVMRFTKDYNLGYPEEYAATSGDLKDKILALYGGNTAVMIWDDEKCAEIDPLTKKYKTQEGMKDHVHIGTGQFKKVEIDVPAGGDISHFSKKGLYEKIIRKSDSGNVVAYVYQTSGAMEAGKEYYEKVADGGVYGGGRKVFAEAFRSIDIAYYGYAERSPQNPKLLNTIQRADVATVKDCCIDLIGASDFTVDDYKDIYYAINRVGELRMYSSLDPDEDLDGGWVATDDHDGVRLHTTPRSRNYIALYNKTNHLGAFYSNWSFEKKYHGDDGSVTIQDESPATYGYPNDGKVSFVNRKHRFVDFYTPFINYKKSLDAVTNPVYNLDSITKYKNAYEAFTDKDLDISTELLADKFEAVRQAYEDEFKKRNVATSGNMIGISSGYELSFEGLACQDARSKEESRYYGPAYGVTEIKLLTTVSGMGGGYVYALNHHYDPEVDGSQLGAETLGWCEKFGQDFLQTSGNFVFPGAAYQTTNDGNNVTHYNYIIDDCFDHYDPVNHGYFACDYHDRVITRSTEPLAENINKSHEVHYWYVSGNTYVYNLTITGITSDPTAENPSRNFWLSNDNDMVNLFNVKADTEIKVTEVAWFEHPKDEIAAGDICDLSDLNKQYQLYLTVDHDTRNYLTDQSTEAEKNGAYVIRVPRSAYELAYEEGTGKYINRYTTPLDKAFDTNGVQVDPNPTGKDFVFNGKYIDEKNGSVTNTPRLGIRLVDGQKNRLADQGRDAGTKYYDRYLKPDHYVQVTIETRNGKDEPIIYVINIDIKYVMGPALFGNINIENCALPGEYIYVNADKVEVLMDENLGVMEQSWKLYPNDKTGHRYVNTNKPDSESDPYVYVDLDTDEYTVPSSEKLIHIPAYYYMDGWEVAYIVKANGELFESTLPFYAKKPVVDPDDPDKKILVDDTDQPILENRLQVHNYHRMKPMYNGKVLDLRLVEGARIYLESEEDMNYFFEYLDLMQYSDADLKLPANNTLYTRFTLPDGRVVNPQFCQKLDFFQQNHLTVPTTSEFTQKNNKLDFCGNYHGNGHWMIIPDGASINIANGEGGNMYNTGFVSHVDDETTRIYDRNDGTITNCFYFNEYEKGCLTETGTLHNCYQNTDVKGGPAAGQKFAYNQLLKLTTMGFRYGQAAYNLNGFYLQKRHLLLHEAGAANNSFDLLAKDKKLRAQSPVVTGAEIDDPYKKYAVDYIEWMFNNGDYRYAFYRNQLSQYGSQFTEALRNAEVPNYYDGLNQRANHLPVSMHDYEEVADTEGNIVRMHAKDEKRWCDKHEVYHPLYDTDYLFFGEDLSEDADDKNNSHLPELYTPETRVYRVGGFYGSAVDKGFFMNEDASVDSPQLTALDFVGYRDKELYTAPGKLKAEIKKSLTDTGWWICNGETHSTVSSDQWQEMFMPPTIDVPWVEDAVDGKHAEFKSFKISKSDKVTHNLLIYTHDNHHSDSVMTKYHYSTTDLGKTLHSYAEHDESLVKAHHILDDPNGIPKAHGGMMHLVDAHDFNAPVAFAVNEAWYTRQPHDYADEYTVTSSSGTKYAYKSAWEGICLPYDVRKTYAASTNSTYMSDMGEITHFFDDEPKGHEYWLRRYVGVNAEKTHLEFERPTELNKGKAIDFVADYLYRNPTFYNMYIDFGYNADHDDLYHSEDDPDKPLDLERKIKNYRHLSHNVPYVVAFPGKRYYEFDLSGEFYCSKNDKVTSAVPQTITYFANGEPNSSSLITIPVTDKTNMVEYDKAGYVMHGTFKHVTNDDALSASVLYDKVTDLMVLDACPVTSSGEIQDEKHIGERFEAKSDTKAGDKVVVLPFRVYMTTASGSSPAPMRIGSRGCITPGDVIEDIDPEEQPGDDDDVQPGIEVWAEGSALMVRTPYDVEMYVFNSIGQVVRYIKAYEGVNRYTGLPSALYIVNGTKVLIRR